MRSPQIHALPPCSGRLAEDMAQIVDGYRRAAAEMAPVIDGLERMVVALRTFVPVAAVNPSRARQRGYEIGLQVLIEGLAVATIAEAVAALPIESYDQADRLRQRMRRLVDIAVDRAAEAGADLAAAAIARYRRLGRP